jgi:hypothetical protein
MKNFFSIGMLLTLAALLTACPPTGTPPTPEPTVSSLKLTVQTGGDDLRGGAQAYAQIRFTDNTTTVEVSLNGGRGWGNDTTNSVDLSLPSGKTLNQLQSLTIRHDGNTTNIFESYDNWNVNLIKLQVNIDGTLRSLTQVSG